MRAKPGSQAPYSAYYQSPIQQQNQFSVVVDGRQPGGDVFDAGGIVPPPLAYSSSVKPDPIRPPVPSAYCFLLIVKHRANPSRYAPYSSGVGAQQAGQVGPGQFEGPYDAFGMPAQPSLYSSSVPSSTYPSSGQPQQGRF